MTVSARRASPGDLDRVVELLSVAYGELTPHRGGDIWSVREGRALPGRDSFEDAIVDALVCLIVGCIDDYVAGYGLVRLTPLRDGTTMGVVEDIFVEAPFREVGVGEALMDGLMEFSRSNGARGIDSLALPGDRETKNFFESFGLKARALLVHRSFDDE